MGYRVPFKVSSSLLLRTGTRHKLQYRYVSSESPRDAPWLRARESLGKSLTFYAEGNEGSERPAPFTCSLPVSGRVYRPRPAFADARAIRRMHDVTRVAMRPAGPSPASHTRTPVCPVDGRPRLPPSLQGFWDLHSQRLLLACRRTGQSLGRQASPRAQIHALAPIQPHPTSWKGVFELCRKDSARGTFRS